MDTSEIYYSDNSQLIETSNSSWIEQHTVLIGNENLTWQEDGPEVTVNYSETSPNRTITENDGYLTAEADESDETSHYFSVLESNHPDSADTTEETADLYTSINIMSVASCKEEMILPDIQDEIHEELETEERQETGAASPEMVLYRMDGTDEIFGLQMADDGSGNMQRYRFKVREIGDGQYEAIPGSIEIHNEDDDEQIPSDPNDDASKNVDIKPDIGKIKSEMFDPPIHEPEVAISEQEDYPDIEPVEENEYSGEPEEEEEEEYTNINTSYLLQTTYGESDEEHEADAEQEADDEEQEADEEQTEEIEHHEIEEGPHEIDEMEAHETDDHSQNENVFIPADGDNNGTDSEYEIEELEDAYQDEINYDEEQEPEPHILQHTGNRRNITTVQKDDARNITVYQDDNNLSYLVVNTKEKENVENSQNLRSILKTNCFPHKKLMLLHKLDRKSAPASSQPVAIAPKETPKEVIPILSKSARQPRKQTIKPVERDDSEITVQPLVYCVGNANEIILPPLEPRVPPKRKRLTSEVQQISDDSDPEYTIKPTSKKKKHKRRGRPSKIIQITILDTDDEEAKTDGSIIEVLTDDEDENAKDDNTTNNNKDTAIAAIDLIDSDSERNNTNEETTDQEVVESKENETKMTDETDGPKPKKANETDGPKPKKANETPGKKNKCPMCPKTFPRLITLKKHMNIHSVRRSLRSNKYIAPEKIKNDVSKPQKPPPTITKKQFNCIKCKITFQSELQYKRHQTVHNVNLNGNSTTRIYPKSKKQISSSPNRKLRSSSLRNKPVEAAPAQKQCFKCEYCPQTFSQRTALAVHRTGHKTFPCRNCKTLFTNKKSRDDHVRTLCVTKRTINTVKSPVKRPFKCTQCPQMFFSPRTLKSHTVLRHKRKTITTGVVKTLAAVTVSNNQKMIEAKKKTGHGGIAVSTKMQRALDKMRLKT